MAGVTLQGVAKRYGDSTVIHGIDLDIADGEFVVFVGPSGCGKSTLLRMIAGLEEISAGTLLLDGRRANDVPPAQRGLAMVFQSYALYPHMTVFENMAFALQLAKQPKAQIRAAVERAAEVLQIGPLLGRRPKDLSGGQRQRVAIGRAIVRQPALFLFDEPLSNLDASLRVQMRVELSRLHRELNTTMIYVTHDQVEAMTLGQRIVVFDAGRIEQVGTPRELYDAPASLFVAGFLGSPKMNLLPATVTGGIARLADGTPVALPFSCADGAVTIGIRPEHVLEAADAALAATVTHVEYLGDQTIVHVLLAGSPIALKRAPQAAPVTAGDRLGVRLPAQHCLVFGADGKRCQG